MARRRKATNKRSIDFSNATRYFEPDERVLLVVKSAEWGDSPTDQENEAPLFVTFGGEGKYSDREIVHRVAMTSKALGYAREFFEAMGYGIEDGEAVEIDTDDLVDRKCWAETYERKYTNDEGEERTTTAIREFEPAEEGDGEEAESSKKKGGKKKKNKEQVSREDVEVMDRGELEELIEEHDLEVDPSEKKLKRPAKLKKAVLDALEEADLLVNEEEEEEEEEEKEKPKGKRGRSSRGSKKSKKKSTNWSSEDIEEMSEEELDEIVDQAGLDIDLSDFKTLRKKRNQLIDALEAEEMLSD